MAIAAMAGIAASGDVSVTASRSYVDKKTALYAVSNGTQLVGYTLGTDTNVVLMAAGSSTLKDEETARKNADSALGTALTNSVNSLNNSNSTIKADLKSHTEDERNPHGVTAGQVGVATTNGVVWVSGTASSALDAGDGSKVRYDRAYENGGGYLDILDEYESEEHNRKLLYRKAWVFSARVPYCYQTADAPDDWKYGTNVFDTILVPDGGRVLTDKQVEMSGAGVVARASKAYSSETSQELRYENPYDSGVGQYIRYFFDEDMYVDEEEKEADIGWFDVSTTRNYHDEDGVLTYTNAVSRLVADGSDFVTEDKLKKLGFSSASSPSLSTNQISVGVTYEKGGHDQNTAIAIGKGAQAALPESYVSSLTNAATLRSVSVAIGGYADALSQSASSKNASQAIAIGYCSQAKASNAIAIGSGAQHMNETAMSGGATVANANLSVAVGYSAKATASNAWQFGAGTNATQKSLKFYDTYVVKDNRLAVPVETNDVEAIAEAMLAPRTLTLDGNTADEVKVQSHAITTLEAVNAPVDEVVFEATASRNFEIYVPNTAMNREGLPMSFDVESTNSVTKRLGEWWDRKIVRLPALVKFREPKEGWVLADVETFDEGDWDWTPVATNAVWETRADDDGVETMHLSKVRGFNLHTASRVRVEWVSTNGVTNVVTSAKLNIPLFGAVSPTFEPDLGIPVAEMAEGVEPVVTAYEEASVMPEATINAIHEAVEELMEQKKGWR